MLGHWEILVIFLIVLLIFGGKKIPEVAKGLGKGFREFRNARDGAKKAVSDIIEETVDTSNNKIKKSKNGDTPSEPI